MISTQSIFFIVLSILFGSASRILIRYVVKETEPYAFSLLVNAISTVLWLPLALATLEIPTQTIAWITLAIAAILWAISSVADYISRKGAEVSIHQPLSQSKLIWGLLIGIFLLKETATTSQLIGNIAIFIGIGFLLWHPEKKFGKLRDPGVKWTLGAAILTAATAAIDKFALGWFKPEVYGFLVFLLPTIILLAFLPGRTQHVKHLMRHRGKTAILAIVLATTAYYFTLKAYAITEFIIVYPLLQTGTLITVIGGIILLKEHEHFWQRIIATILIVAGAMLIGF